MKLSKDSSYEILEVFFRGYSLRFDKDRKSHDSILNQIYYVLLTSFLDITQFSYLALVGTLFITLHNKLTCMERRSIFLHDFLLRVSFL